MKTLTRYIPAGSSLTAYPEQKAEVYTYSVNNSFYAMGYYGKANKPAFHFRFKSEQHRSDYIQNWLKALTIREQRKADRKAQLDTERAKAKTAWNVGDIISHSWGYEQTNVEFYKVISVKGSSLTLAELGQSTVEGSAGNMCCDVMPTDKIIGKPFTKRATRPDSITMTSYSSARRWHGRAMYKSWYY